MKIKSIIKNNKYLGLTLGLVFMLINLLYTPDSLNIIAWRTLGVAILMATWWLTEALPLPATSLLPILLFPILGINTIKETAFNYAHPIIFLFFSFWV